MVNEKTIISKVAEPDITELAGEKVMIDFATGSYIMLKGTANAIWDMLKVGITVEEVVDNLLKEYDVDRETCMTSVCEFINNLVERKFIEISE